MTGDCMAVACAELFRGDGAILASPMLPLARLGAQLAQATFEPDLVLTDGTASIVSLEGEVEGWMPYSRVFDVLWGGRRHVVMGAAQLDRFGNQNLSCIGDHRRPKAQLLGVRGAPGNTACHATSYLVPAHHPRVFVPSVDFASGIGTDRGARDLRRVVTNLAVLDFRSPDGSMRIASLHPGVSVDRVREATGFELAIADDLAQTRGPTEAERGWLERLDPSGAIRGSVA